MINFLCYFVNAAQKTGPHLSFHQPYMTTPDCIYILVHVGVHQQLAKTRSKLAGNRMVKIMPRREIRNTDYTRNHLGRYVDDTWDNLSNETNKSILPFNSTSRRMASNTNGRHGNNPMNSILAKGRPELTSSIPNVDIHQQPEFLNVRFVVAYPQNLSFYLFFCFSSIKWVLFRKPDFKDPTCLP